MFQLLSFIKNDFYSLLNVFYLEKTAKNSKIVFDVSAICPYCPYKSGVCGNSAYPPAKDIPENDKR